MVLLELVPWECGHPGHFLSRRDACAPRGKTRQECLARYLAMQSVNRSRAVSHAPCARCVGGWHFGSGGSDTVCGWTEPPRQYGSMAEPAFRSMARHVLHLPHHLRRHSTGPEAPSKLRDCFLEWLCARANTGVLVSTSCTDCLALRHLVQSGRCPGDVPQRVPCCPSPEAWGGIRRSACCLRMRQ